METNFQMPNFMNIGQVEAELFHADRETDGRTETTTLKVAIRNFATGV